MWKTNSAIFALTLAVYLLTPSGDPGQHRWWAQTYAVEHVVQADALLHGRIYVDYPVMHERVEVNNHYYLLHPPLSAIVMMPFAAIWGLKANQTLVCIFIGALNVMLAWRFLTVCGLGKSRYWWTLFFALGTTLWYEATDGASWDFCLVLSIAPTLMALTELEDKQRPWVVGLWAAIAAFARYDLALVWPVYAAMLYVRSGRLGNAIRMLHPCYYAVLLYFGYNLVRFHTISDPSLFIWYRTDAFSQFSPYGPFSIHYLPMNLYTALFMGPAFTPNFPWIHPVHWGQSLIITSPALLLTLRADLGSWTTRLLWLAVFCAMLPPLLVYANGFDQFGARYWVQVYPFLLALLALSRIDQMSKILIAASVLFVAFGTFHIRLWGFA